MTPSDQPPAYPNEPPPTYSLATSKDPERVRTPVEKESAEKVWKTLAFQYNVLSLLRHPPSLTLFCKETPMWTTERLRIDRTFNGRNLMLLPKSVSVPSWSCLLRYEITGDNGDRLGYVEESLIPQSGPYYPTACIDIFDTKHELIMHLNPNRSGCQNYMRVTQQDGRPGLQYIGSTQTVDDKFIIDVDVRDGYPVFGKALEAESFMVHTDDGPLEIYRQQRADSDGYLICTRVKPIKLRANIVAFLLYLDYVRRLGRNHFDSALKRDIKSVRNPSKYGGKRAVLGRWIDRVPL